MVVRPSALQRGGDKNAPAATFGAYLCAVRTMLRIVRIQHCKRQKGVRQGGISPLTLFCFLLQEQKEAKGRPRRRGVQTRPCERPRDAVRRLQTRPRRRAVLIKPCIRLCDADRRLQTWPPPAGGTAHVHTIINYHTTKRRRCQCVILCRGMVVILGQNCYTGVKG